MFLLTLIAFAAFWFVSPGKLYDLDKFNSEKSRAEKLLKEESRFSLGFVKILIGRWFLIYLYYRSDLIFSVLIVLAIVELLL